MHDTVWDLRPAGSAEPDRHHYEKSGGPRLTKTLLFIGQGIESNRLRAFDKDTGYELFEMELPARSSSAPVSYLADGRQYIALAVGGGDAREQLVALALPGRGHSSLDLHGTCRSCFHACHMSAMIQIRNVPDSLHRRLKARAAMEGVSMSLYVLREIERALARPSRQEVLQAIREQPGVALDRSPADVLRDERGLR